MEFNVMVLKINWQFQIPHQNFPLGNLLLVKFWFSIKEDCAHLFEKVVKKTPSFSNCVSVWDWIFLLYFNQSNVWLQQICAQTDVRI